MTSSQTREEILPSKESPAEDHMQPSFAGESVTEYFVKNIMEFDKKPRMWDEKDLVNIVIMELLDISQVLIYDPVKLEELIEDTEFFGSYKEVIRINLEKNMLAFRIEKKEYIKKLLDIKFLNVSEDSDEGSEFNGSDSLENMKLPVRCYSVDQKLNKAERWWEENTCVVINKTNIIRFSNNEDLASSQLNSIVQWSHYMKTKQEYFVGMCQHCCSSTLPGKKLSRCGGCQLVGYCSKDCQKADRKQHKEVCKEYSVNHIGVNILRRAQDIVEGIKPIEKKMELFISYLFLVDWNKDFLKNKVSRVELETTVKMAKECDVKLRFDVLKFPRICSMCCEARLEKLQDCSCNCVTYCSTEHKNADVKHQARCKKLGLLADTYAHIRNNGPISDLPYPLQADNHWPKENMESLLNSLNSSAKSRVPINGSRSSIENEIESAKDVTAVVKLSLLSERLSLPLTVLSVLQQVGVGLDKTPIENIAKLHIHNLCFRPLLDPGAWEFFMHCLPGLKQLHISYTEEDAVQLHSMSINHLNTNTTLTRCQDCIDQNRLITYAIYPFSYEIYVSSNKYPEPDVITVAECGELIQDELDDMEEVYINLMQHRDCRVVFTDNSLDKLCETISEVNNEVPVDVLIDPKENTFAGFSQMRTMDPKEGGVTILNSHQFVSCLIKNNEKDK